MNKQFQTVNTSIMEKMFTSTRVQRLGYKDPPYTIKWKKEQKQL